MKVYIITEGSYSDERPIAAFTEEDKAREMLESMGNSPYIDKDLYTIILNPNQDEFNNNLMYHEK